MKKIIISTEEEGDAKKWIERESGRKVFDLFFNPETNEKVRLEHWAPGVEVKGLIADGGEEILVWEGGYQEKKEEAEGRAREDEEADTGEGMHWIRNPAKDAGKPYHRIAGERGCKLLIKEGHLGL